MAFETSIYTDVTAEESLNGMSGFGFQSVSDGLDGTAKAFIVEHMLHRNSPYWDVAREETDHPETFAFVAHDDRFYFSRGRSTGKTNSGRRGNQLTEAVVTADIDDITPYVPAQVLGSPQWSVERRDSQDSGQWYAPLDIPEELEQLTLIEWVQDDAARSKFLVALVSSLEQRETKKTVVVATSSSDAIRWFTLGTLLINRREAMQLDLRGFTDNPFGVSAPLVAVHPDLMPQRLAGANVFNADTLSAEAMESSPSARTCVKWINAMDSDDALVAIGQFRAWEPALGTQLAADATEMLSDAQPDTDAPTWSVGIGVIRGLAEAELFDELQMYGDELTDALRGYIPSSTDEFVDAAEATAFARSVDVDGLTEAILDATFEGLFHHSESVGPWARALLADQQWSWEGHESYVELLLQLLEIAPTSHDKNSILQLTGRTPRSISAEQLQTYVLPVTTSLVSEELQVPGTLGADIATWPDGPRALGSLVGQLHQALEQQPDLSNQQVQHLVAGRWDALSGFSGRVPEAAALDPWFLAAHLARIPLDQRGAALEQKKGSVNSALWRIVLHDAHLPSHLDLFTSWASTQHTPLDMNTQIEAEVDRFVRQDPAQMKPRDADGWLALAEAVAASKPNSSSRQATVRKLEQFKDEIPSFQDKTNTFFNNLAKPFRGKKKTEDKHNRDRG